VEVEYPNGRYFLRSYEDGQKVYKEVESCHPRDAMFALQRAQRAATAEGAARNPLRYIEGAIDAYVKDLKQRKVHEMAEKAQHVLGEFQEVCRRAGIVHVVSITRQHVLNFHKTLRENENSDRTVRDKHDRIKSWLRFCKVDTTFMPPAPKYEETLPTIYEPSEVKAIREAAHRIGDTYMLVAIDLALKLGLRDQEIMHAEWSDIDHHNKIFRVQGKVRKEWDFAVKDKQQRDVPIPADLLQSLLAWHHARPDTLLIVGNHENKPEGHILRKLKTLVRNAGLNCGKCDGCQRKGYLAECGEIELHKFRRTCITTWLRSGLDLSTVQHLAGHSDISSTIRYLRPAAAKDLHDKINAIKWE
jgi:integrase